ncbi:MAG: hypothetical protein R3F62_27305 [Planctomycetota bacterium]
MITLAFMNVNNLYLRYRFGARTPGRFGNDPPAPEGWGYLPSNFPGCYEAHDPVQVGLLADVLSYEGLPEVLALCEVESIEALRHFNRTALGGHYPHAQLVGSRDPRQIDVGLLTTLPVRGLRSHVDDYDRRRKEYVFSRDCLEAVLELPSGEPLTLLITQLKSRFVDPMATGERRAALEKRAGERRRRQARAIRQILRERFPCCRFQRELFAVVGDLNDTPDSPWVTPLTRHAGLLDALSLLPPEERWTYWWEKRNQVSQLDYLLLSPALAGRVKAAGCTPRIERGGIGFSRWLEDGWVGPRLTTFFSGSWPRRDIPFQFDRFEGVLTGRRRASDHCAASVALPC